MTAFSLATCQHFEGWRIGRVLVTRPRLPSFAAGRGLILVERRTDLPAFVL